MKTSIAILGSTGSIGKSLLKIVEKENSSYKIILLTADKNYKDYLESLGGRRGWELGRIPLK